MSTFANVESKSHEGPCPHHTQPTDSYVEEEDNLEPVEQGGDSSSVPLTYKDVDRYTPIAKPGTQSTIQPQNELIPLRVIPPRPQGHDVTPARDAGPEPGQAGGYLEPQMPADSPDRPARTNRNIKWFVVGLAVLAVIGVVVWITVTHTTGNGATGHCTSIPCKNAGTCNDIQAGFTCQCVTGYSGDICQHDNDECETSPCLNGGTCEDLVNGFTCRCHPRYSGNSCQTENTGCDRKPCLHGSICSARGNHSTCYCLPGYRGTLCQNDIDECESSPCVNLGTCEDQVNGYACHCLPGYSGTSCQTDTDECESGPCLNLGTCEDRVNGYACECQPGYSGNSCQTDTDECESGPCLNLGSCEDRVDGYTCQCRPGYGGAYCQGSQVAFSVNGRLSIGQSNSWRRVEYKNTLTDLGGAWHNPIFSTPASNVYYLAMSAGAWYVHYRLWGAPHSPGLSATSTNLNIRTLGRACLLDIPAEQEIRIKMRGFLLGGDQTSWSIFSLTAAFHPLVAFTVSKTTPTTELGKVPFSESLLNTTGGYRLADGHFVAPYNGIYVFTVSAGVAAFQKARLHIVKNDVGEIELLRADTTHNGIEMISSAAIVKLSRGDRVHVELMEGSLYSDPESRHTSFSGFLYSPLHGQSIAWSVWLSRSWSGNGTIANQDPVPFDTVLVNEGGVYNTSQHVVTVPVSGVYCVHIVAGAPGGEYMGADILYGPSMSGASTATYIYDIETYRNGVTTISNSVLITVAAGDLVWASGSGFSSHGVYSNPGLVTGFSGFLVYPTEV